MELRNHTGMRRLVKKKKFLQQEGNVDRFGYLGSDVVDYNIVDGPLTGYSYQYPEVEDEESREPGERQTSEMEGVMDFLAGTKLTNMLTLSLPIPLCEFSDLCKNLKTYHPIQPWFTAALISGDRSIFVRQQCRRGLTLHRAPALPCLRQVHAQAGGGAGGALQVGGRPLGQVEWGCLLISRLSLSRYGLPGKSCVLRAVCELAQAGGLAGQGLAGRAAQALMLMEYAEEEEALVDYLTARAVGRRRSGQCSAGYTCPLPLGSMASMAEMVSSLDMQTVAALLQALPLKDVP